MAFQSPSERLGYTPLILPVALLKKMEPSEERGGLGLAMIGATVATLVGVFSLIPKESISQDEIDGLIEEDGDLDKIRAYKAQRQEEIRRLKELNPTLPKPPEVPNSLVQRVLNTLRAPFQTAPPAPSPILRAPNQKPMGPVDSGGTLTPGPVARKKQEFEGFSGAEGLTKYGRYTDEEAAKITYLKKSGAFTGAASGASVAPYIIERLKAAAQKYGVPYEALLKTMLNESGGNPNAISFTGAIGLFQLTGSTASALGATNRFDIDQNIEAGAKLMRENTRYGLGNSTEALYYLHQLGPRAAKEVMNSSADASLDSLSPGTQKAISLNAGGKVSTTVGQYRAYTQRSLERRYETYTSNQPKVQAEQKTATTTSVTLGSEAAGLPNRNTEISPRRVPEVSPRAKTQQDLPARTIIERTSLTDAIILDNGIPIGVQ